MNKLDIEKHEAGITALFFGHHYTQARLNQLEEKVQAIHERIYRESQIGKASLSEAEYGFSAEEQYEKATNLMPITEIDREFEKWHGELSFFNSTKKDLLENKSFRNKFVAIKDKKLIDVDIDKFRLVKRVSEKHPNGVVLIAKVEMGVAVAEIPSPEVSL